MFDPRLTEEYCGCRRRAVYASGRQRRACRDGSRRIVVGRIQLHAEARLDITKAGSIGCQYGYVNLPWQPASPVFHKARAIGLRVQDWQDVILVNMLGQRFYDETGATLQRQQLRPVPDYVPGNWRNARDIKYNPRNFLNAAMAGIGDAVTTAADRSGPSSIAGRGARGLEAGAAVRRYRRRLLLQRQHASRAGRQHQEQVPARADAAEVLEATVARYNAFVDAASTRISRSRRRSTRSGAAVLRGLVDAGHPRHARRPAHRRAVPGRRPAGRGDTAASTAAASRPAGSASTAWRAAWSKGRIAGIEAASEQV